MIETIFWIIGFTILVIVGNKWHKARLNHMTPPQTVPPVVVPVTPYVPTYPSYEVVSEQCSGELPNTVMYDTLFRVYFGKQGELNIFQNVRVQTSWKYSNGEVAGTHDTGVLPLSEYGVTNEIYYSEPSVAISIPINSTQANLTAHITISFFDAMSGAQIGADVHTTYDIMFPCS